jgi:hypothetical protein
MIDAKALGRNQHIKAKLDTDAGSLELLLDHSTSDVCLAPDEVYDLFAWLYSYHRDMLVFQMLRATLGIEKGCCIGERYGLVDGTCYDSSGHEQPKGQDNAKSSMVCFLCQREGRITCELCKKPLCLSHRREVTGYFSVRRYSMCEGCVQHYQNFVGASRLW